MVIIRSAHAFYYNATYITDIFFIKFKKLTKKKAFHIRIKHEPNFSSYNFYN